MQLLRIVYLCYLTVQYKLQQRQFLWYKQTLRCGTHSVPVALGRITTIPTRPPSPHPATELTMASAAKDEQKPRAKKIPAPLSLILPAPPTNKSTIQQFCATVDRLWGADRILRSLQYGLRAVAHSPEVSSRKHPRILQVYRNHRLDVIFGSVLWFR